MSNKGRDIRTFFQPSSQAQEPTLPPRLPPQPKPQPEGRRPPPQDDAATSSRLSDSSASSPSAALPPMNHSLGLHLLSLPSSPRTPQKGVKNSFARTDEIKGSDDDLDDDEEDSDSSVESLSAIFGLSKPSPKIDRQALSTTPKAKRVASMGGGAAHGSPLTLQQSEGRGGVQKSATKHKFDMKALLAHARQEERTAESARRAQELIDMSDEDNKSDSKSHHDGAGNLQDQARALLEGGEDENGEKLVRAIDRTKSKPTRRCCYFFSPGLSSSAVKGQRAPFPYDALTGRWKFLQNPTTRDQSMIHHLPHTLVSRGVQLPEELLLWILEETCVESNAQLRFRYCELVNLCGETAGPLVSTDKLYTMLHGIGGPSQPISDEKLSSVMEQEEAYTRRDWGPLRSFLHMLAKLAPSLSDPVGAILLLLRMSLDPICGTVVRHEHAAALEALITSLPESAMQQNTVRICAFLDKHIEETILKVQAINSIPKTTPQLRRLWRGVAQGTLFGHDCGKNGLSLDAILKRLEQRDFAITHSTDFEEYKSLVTLLDSAIGNGAFLRLPPREPQQQQPRDAHDTSTSARPAANAEPVETTKADANKRFDAAVDALTRRVEVLQNKIHDSNSAERKEAKTALDALAKRLAYSVRTRPPRKPDIFDEALLRFGGGGAVGGGKMAAERARREEEVEMPRQRNFMMGWASTARRMDSEQASRLNAVLVDGETGRSHSVS